MNGRTNERAVGLVTIASSKLLLLCEPKIHPLCRPISLVTPATATSAVRLLFFPSPHKTCTRHLLDAFLGSVRSQRRAAGQNGVVRPTTVVSKSTDVAMTTGTVAAAAAASLSRRLVEISTVFQSNNYYTDDRPTTTTMAVHCDSSILDTRMPQSPG